MQAARDGQASADFDGYPMPEFQADLPQECADGDVPLGKIVNE